MEQVREKKITLYCCCICQSTIGEENSHDRLIWRFLTAKSGSKSHFTVVVVVVDLVLVVVVVVVVVVTFRQ